jgi:hypothetical protein
MFDHAHYVPVLRWKAGERAALKTLRPGDKAFMTPIVELLPGYMRPRRAKISGPKTDDLAVVVDQIAECWGSDPIFVDVKLGFGVPYRGSRARSVERLFEGFAAAGVRAIPVSRPDYAAESQSEIKQAAFKAGNGLAMRVPATSLRTPTAGHAVLELVEDLGTEPGSVDLIVEYGPISATDPTMSFVCHRLPEISWWRTFTVLGGSFPPDLMAVKRPGQYEVQREEWNRWTAEVIATDLTRRPSFGDYTIQHAVYYEPVEGANPSASIRYTSDTCWVIMRGEGLRTPGSAGHAQYPANAELLCGRKEFCGPEFSAGDAYIWRIGSGEDPRTGSPETWLRAGINHHLTFAARQIQTAGVAGA